MDKPTLHWAGYLAAVGFTTKTCRAQSYHRSVIRKRLENSRRRETLGTSGAHPKRSAERLGYILRDRARKI
ncbi:unnamed protein product, partial [Iphiclides podalirius]